MSFAEKVRLIQRLDAFIRRKGTGCHKSLARRLNTSISSLYRRMDELRTLGAEIEYCTIRQTYYYTNDFKF